MRGRHIAAVALLALLAGACDGSGDPTGPPVIDPPSAEPAMDSVCVAGVIDLSTGQSRCTEWRYFQAGSEDG